jgi:hypothetical protein
MVRCVFFTTMLAAAGMANAYAESLPESLLHCDSRFFSTLYTSAPLLKNTAPLIKKKPCAWFTHPENGNDVLWFTQPVRAGKLTLEGYFRRDSIYSNDERFYFWGLIVSEPPQEVIAALPDFQWKADDAGYMANGMIMRPGDSEWQENRTAVSGIATAKGSTERVVLIETHLGKTQLLCSVQGSVTDGQILPLRPDLAGEK